MCNKLWLQLFGSPQITWQGKPITGFVSNKARALLIYLAVTRRAHSRDALAELLWADTPATKRANLKKALSNVRTREGVALMEEGQRLVALDLERCWVDVAEFEQLADDTSADNVDALQRAVQLYQGDFLSGFNLSLSYEFEAWALGEQAHLKEQMVEALRRLAAGYAQRNDLTQAIAAMRHLLQLEPWREEAHCQLMELLARSGDRNTALKQYELLQQILMAEFGDDTVAEATEQLYHRILNSEIEVLPSVIQTIDASNPRVHEFLIPIENIPAPGTLPTGSIMPLRKNPLFVGREQDLRTLAQELNSSDTAAVSQVETAATTGLGGIGKTQLACEFVHRYGRFFPCGRVSHKWGVGWSSPFGGDFFCVGAGDVTCGVAKAAFAVGRKPISPCCGPFASRCGAARGAPGGGSCGNGGRLSRRRAVSRRQAGPGRGGARLSPYPK